MEWNKEKPFETVEAAIEAIKGVGGYQIRTQEEEKTFLENATKIAASESAKAERKLLLDSQDKEIASILGKEKDPSKRTIDHITDVIKELKEGRAQIEGDFDKFKNEKLSDSDAALEVKKQFDKFRSSSKEEADALRSSVETMKREQFDSRINSDIQASMSKIRGTLKENEFLDDAIQTRVDKFKREFIAKEYEGSIIYHSAADDSPVLDSGTGNHLSTNSILEGIFKPLVDTGRVQNGTGNGSNQGSSSKSFSAPSDIKTKVQLSQYLDEGNTKMDGHVVEKNSPEYARIITDSQLPLR